MENEFIPYEQALDLKELGFDEYCLAEYRQWDGRGEYLHLNEDDSLNNHTTECKAPLYQQAFRWFRDEYGLYGSVETRYQRPFEWRIAAPKETAGVIYAECYSYEEAELACLKRLIETVKQ